MEFLYFRYHFCLLFSSQIVEAWFLNLNCWSKIMKIFKIYESWLVVRCLLCPTRVLFPQVRSKSYSRTILMTAPRHWTGLVFLEYFARGIFDLLYVLNCRFYRLHGHWIDVWTRYGCLSSRLIIWILI